MASSLLFCLNASSGYLSLAAANAGVQPKRMSANPISASTAAPLTTMRRAASTVSFGWFMCFSSNASRFQRLQKIHHRLDLFLAQDAVAAERGHHGQWIALGFIGHDRDQIVAVGIFRLDVDQLGTDGARQVAPLDHMAGQAIPLAPIESKLLALGDARLRNGRHGAQRERYGREKYGFARRNLQDRHSVFISVASYRAVPWCGASNACLPR